MTTREFHTPPRILIPKLVRSRDGWKAKAAQRKAQRKALQVRVRDLCVSRDRHRRRADLLQQQLDQRQLQLDHTEQQRVQLQARLEAAAPKKQTPTPTGHAADTTTPP
jgi:chromosome segregation ATPase